MDRFDSTNFHLLCDHVAGKDKELKRVITEYNYPPLWVRPNKFETLVLTILEQQVSLASAYAAYKKLKEKIRITPVNLLLLTDEELRSCYFSRQKIIYARELARAIVSKKVQLKKFEEQENEVVRTELKKLKGIGDWTVDVYLMHSLRRTDIFPIGDLALVNAIKMVKEIPGAGREQLLKLSEQWKPYRSIATMIFWHYYIRTRNIKLLH
jgi:DNA-3-methyladenine glycosylase II